jgi:hypothetical protein
MAREGTANSGVPIKMIFTRVASPNNNEIVISENRVCNAFIVLFFKSQLIMRRGLVLIMNGVVWEST